MSLTARALAALKTGKWLTEAGNRNEGALRAKGSPHGARFYFRYRDGAGNYDDLPIGSFDLQGKRGLTLDQARTRVRNLRNRYMAGDRDLRTTIEAEERERQLKQETHQRDFEIRQARAQATLGALLAAYVEQLVRDGKPSAQGVRTAIKRHVEDQWPVLWKTAAADISMDDLLAMVAKVADTGKLREAAKLRSYLRAAYGSAIRARQDARGLAALRDLRITSNPAHDLVTVEGASKARDRALSVAELRAYWKRITKLPGSDGALLRFHLLTGAQRVEQLARLTMDDYDSDLKSIRISDSKGRRKAPRAHDVPLIPEALDAMNAMAPVRIGPYVVTVTQGQSGAVYTSIQQRLRLVIAGMAEAGELEKGEFTIGDLRRTVETRLAAEGVPPDVRAQLQSHGLGGVQSRHYDRHDYHKEKRSALETLYRLLTTKPGKVVEIKRGRRA